MTRTQVGRASGGVGQGPAEPWGKLTEVARSHRQVICVALHPGTVATAFTRNYRNHDVVSAPQAAANLPDVMDGLTTADTGGFFDWVSQPVAW